MRLLCAVIIMSLTFALAEAKMYQWIAEDGSVTFKDTPPPTSKKHKKVKVYDDSDFAPAPPPRTEAEARAEAETRARSIARADAEASAKRRAKAEEKHRANLEAKAAECKKSCESNDRICAMVAHQDGYSVGQQRSENRKCAQDLRICNQRCEQIKNGL